MRRFLGLLLLVGILLVVATYTVLPAVLEGYVARNVQDRLGSAETPEVDLSSNPAPLMLTGRFSDGRIELPSVQAGNVRPDEVAIDLDPFDVDVVESVRSRSLRTAPPVTGDLRVELSEAEVNRIATAQAASFPITNVDLRGGSAVVSSEVQGFGISAPVGVEGSVTVQDGALVFVPSTVGVFGTDVPEDLAAQLLGGTSFTYPLGEQFGGSVITGVEVLEDRAVLTGELGELPVG